MGRNRFSISWVQIDGPTCLQLWWKAFSLWRINKFRMMKNVLFFGRFAKFFSNFDFRGNCLYRELFRIKSLTNKSMVRFLIRWKIKKVIFLRPHTRKKNPMKISRSWRQPPKADFYDWRWCYMIKLTRYDMVGTLKPSLAMQNNTWNAYFQAKAWVRPSWLPIHTKYLLVDATVCELKLLFCIAKEGFKVPTMSYQVNLCM